jgi:hypothetical protein
MAKVGHFQDGKFHELASGSEEYCPYCGVKAPRPGLHKQGCPAHNKGEE